MLLNWIKKIFGTAQERQLHRYEKIVKQVNRWEEQFQRLSDEEIRNKTEQFRKRVREGETLTQLLPEAYGVVKNVCRRLCGREVHVSGYNQLWDMVPYDVQILGGIAMHYGSIVEMQTGEGKTLTASMPLYLNALSGKGAHLVTVNDYLAQRDCEWMGAIFHSLGLMTGALTGQTPLPMRKKVYQCDIVYGTASEFGFDYLRDHSFAMQKEEKVQRQLHFAIIDEVDSILIDEARTPLIISGPAEKSEQMYDVLCKGVTEIVSLQNSLCQRMVDVQKLAWERLQKIQQEGKKKSHQKEEEREICKKLWVVSKGTPRNQTLRILRENPNVREGMDAWDVYFYSEQNKEEKWKVLSELYILVDEKSSEYELTDRGMELWLRHAGDRDSQNHEKDFVLLDLGEEYGKIDADAALSEKEKVERKQTLQQLDRVTKERMHSLRQLLRACLLMEKDVDYMIQEGKIVIIDEHTGRPQPGRRFSNGLHQAIEAKEGVEIQEETQTHATVTLQNYFRMYEKLSGMTGTAITEEQEFKETYQLSVLQIPTYLPCKRKDLHDEVYMTEREKYAALLKEVEKYHAKGTPMLIGTESVDISEKLSHMLKKHDISHAVLNAKQHEKEAEVIAQAGKRGAVTIATNMAGRGTDIKLGKDVVVGEKVGLYVIGSCRYPSRRIDRQLRGRCARLGDPGMSKFYVSFEDGLMRLFSSPRITAFLKKHRPPEGEALTSGLIDRAIETAQKRVEQRNFMARKYTLEFDNVMNKQREMIYLFRDTLLEKEEMVPFVLSLIEEAITAIGEKFLHKDEDEYEQRVDYHQWLMEHFPITFSESLFVDLSCSVLQLEGFVKEKIQEAFMQRVSLEKRALEETEEYDVEEIDRAIGKRIRNLLLRKVDRLWKDHLLEMDHLRSEITMRSIGQKDPLTEFKYEAFSLFLTLSFQIKTEIIEELFQQSLTPLFPSKMASQMNLFPFSSSLRQEEENSSSPEHILNILPQDSQRVKSVQESAYRSSKKSRRRR